MSGPSQSLLQAKLNGLLREANVTAPDRAVCMGGVARVSDGDAYVLLDDPQLQTLGPVVLWAKQKGVKRLTLMCDEHAGDVARRTSAFESDGCEFVVWRVDGTGSATASPEPVADSPKLSEGVMVFEPLISASGALAVDDHGRLTAEVVGLEVARVTDDSQSEPRLEVGVGQADRELHDYVHGALSDAEALQRAVNSVAPLRTRDSSTHPLNRIARQRWLRHWLIGQPELVGATRLVPLPPLVPKGSLLGSEPVAAVDPRGSVIAVCSVGIDPNLVLEGVDYRLRQKNPGAELVFVVPDRDLHRITTELVTQVNNARTIGVTPPWT